ncbi:MAG: Holliday junction resolvase RuvX [Candidatus Omnitrophota bacterium]
MRVMGIDLGSKRIGIAVSDETGILSQGKEVIADKSEKDAIARIKQLVEELDIKEIVVGFPVNMNGTIGEKAENSRMFARAISRECAIMVKLWDERMSTMEAESVLIRADITRKKRRKVVDKLAAQIILQSYLDSLRYNDNCEE